MDKSRYKDFVDRCYDEKDGDLDSFMEEEIIKVIKESPTPEESSEIIMELILATKYAW